MNEIVIYTDGAAQGNPGKGGYGIVLKFGPHRKEISEGYRMTTNNRMELLAVIVALESITRFDIPIKIYSDSKYVIDSISLGWVYGWEKKGFKGKKNPDLWKRFLTIYKKHHVTFQWVKGHASNVENNRCDELAVAAAQGKDLKIDVAYEQGVNE